MGACSLYSVPPKTSRVKNVVETGGGTGKEKQKTTNMKNQQAAVLENWEDFQNIYEIQRRMKEQYLGHKIVLEALDNASDYVGSSYKRYPH